MRKNARKNQQKYVELSLFPEEEKNDNIKNSISSENKEKEYDISVCQRLYSPTNKEYNLADLFERLSKSAFRSRFRLSKKEKDYIKTSNPQSIGFSGILLAKRQNSFYCTYFLHNRNVADTKSPYPIKRLEVIRRFNQKDMAFNQSLS